jgi:hypothetical protein
MNKTAKIRFLLFLSVAAAVILIRPATAVSQTPSATRVPCPAVMGHACPVLPSPVIPSQRPRMRAASNVKGAEPQSPQLYNSGDPSVDEQYYLELLNAARMNPPVAGVEISNTTDPDVSSEFNYWATQDANEPTRLTIKRDLASYQPKQPLAMNASLLTAARAHSQDMLTNNYQGHQGTDGSWPWGRAQKAGYPSLFGGSSPYVGENAAAYAITVYDAYAGWLIDFGVPNDTQWGHRNNCLEFKTGSEAIDPGYTECGPGMIPNPGGGYPASTGPLVSTLDLGDAGKHFILGVVYNDQNNNGRYDPGEGVSGVRIDVTGASYYAVSATQGGYAIPFSGSGTVTVKATGGPFGTAGMTKSVNFDGANVKVDFTPDLTGYPTQVALQTPMADTILNLDSASFIWNTVSLATSYHIEVSTDSLFKKSFALNDSLLKDTVKIFGAFKDSTTYFWRVRAKNAKGVGGWSAVASFSVALPPSPLALVSPANGAGVGDTTVTFKWRAADKGGYSYLLIVTTDKAMMDTVFQDNPLDTSEFVNVSAFPASPAYYWTVTAQNDNGWSRPSAVRSFTTGASSVSATNVVVAPVVVLPNPTAGESHIRFTLSSDADVSLRVFNTLGEEMQSLALGHLSPGGYDYTLDFSKLAAGSYTYQLHEGDRIETGRIVIMR